MKKVLFFILCMLAVMPAVAQKIGEISYRRVYGGGGTVCKFSKTISGALCPGDVIKSYPVGTVFEAKYIGNGYYSTKAFDLNEEGILTGTENVKAEYADPRKSLGMMFRFDHYAQECPSLGDTPDVSYYVEIDENKQEPEKYGDAIVYLYAMYNPGTPEQKQVDCMYYGRFLPYCISLDSERKGSKLYSMPEERLYTWTDILGNLSGAYFRGERFNLWKNN